MNSSGRVLVGMLAGLGTITLGGLAQAQGSAAIEEVVVTAQKREQSVQDIGIAVAAFSGETLRERGISAAKDLHQLIPNVNLQNESGAGSPVVIVRGIGLQNFRINDSPTTSFYIDEVYQSTIATAEWSMFDMERVEMLKGPQGGLYGRNTIAGAVQVLSRAPEIGEDFNGYVTTGIGRFAEGFVEGAAGGSLGDTIAVRAAGRYGFSGNKQWESSTGGFDHGEDDRMAGRLMLRFAPNESMDFLLKVHGGKDESELPLLRPVGVFANIGQAGIAGLPNVALAPVAFLSPLIPDPPSPYCNSVATRQGSDPASCATIEGLTPQSQGQGDASGDSRFQSASQVKGFQDNSWMGVSLNANFEFGDWRLQSISAWDDVDYRRFVDRDGTAAIHQHIDYNTDIEYWSQEFRLFYDAGGPLTAVVGINYAEDTLKENSILDGRDGLVPVLFGGAIISPQAYTQDTESLAIYGHVEYRVSESINLIGELRYTDAKKSFDGGNQLQFPSGLVVPLVSTNDSISFDALTGKAGIEWFARDNMMLYGSISRGFKTGGYFGGFATTQEELLPYDEESIWAYEAGFKTDWLDGRARLNGAVFYYDRSDVQQSAANPLSPVNIKRLVNVGDVKTYGGELELTWQVDEYLSVMISAGLLDASVSSSDFIQAANIPLLPDAPVDGSNVPNYAEFSMNALARYDYPLGNGWNVWLQGEYMRRSETDLAIITNPLEEPIFREPGYGLVNFRLGLRTPDGRWNVQAFVENAGDEEYRTLARNDGTFGIYELYGDPRTYGASVSYSWE